MGTTLWQAARAATSAATAQDEAEKAELVAALMTDMFRLSDPSETLGDTITARDLLDRGTDRILTEFGDQPVVQAGLLSEVASVYSSLGLFSRAAPLIENALRLREAEFGAMSIQVSESLIQLGEARVDQGEQSEAIELLSRAIDLREPLVMFPDELLVEAKGSLAWLVRSTRRYDRAAELFSEALEGAAILDPGGGLEAELLFGLASTFHDSGQFDEADSVFAVVLAEYDATSRPSPTVISALTNVALIRRLRGQFHEAEPLARAAVDVATALYGSEHDAVFATKTDLGLVLYWTGDWKEADPMLRDAIEGSSEMLGPLHPTTAGLQEALGALLVGMGEYDEAAGLHKLSLEEKIRRLGDVDHPGIVASLVRVAEALTGAGHFEEAREYIARSEAMNRRLGAVPSIYSISSEQSLANITWRERDLEAAEQHFLAAIALADELLSRPDHRYQWLLKYDYGAFLTGTGRAAEAVSILEWVLASQIERLGEPHPMVERTRAVLQEARRG
jgi:tetratricopeptide (TPR) repeat protein